ncbi:alpha/beta-hydrolase [Piromyces finnis]|uniref:sn-1-specific diacylglycerol lipase n=1 Tax=Piromyces finnis TaxID=1754191 RepID=A0A1Y1VB36_9FUNG|nr:alpha/beta-hydrolase [Piromyces finnis]|eukprot:ORX51771.1 alpha/beta-hydrolase [Piromyces finnis]
MEEKGKGIDISENVENVNENEKSLIIKDMKNNRPCLLPSAIASRITTMATTSCQKIRTASSVVDTLYELAKAGTDASFDLSRNVLIKAIKIARSIHRDEENENPNSFIKALDACTDFGINIINNTFSATEVMTLTSFHLAQKGLRYTFKWAEEALVILDSVFGKTETSREISALLYLITSEIRNYVKNESNIIKKGLRSINFIKAVTVYACLQIMTYDNILKKRKMTLLYEGNSYLEPIPNKLIESEENEFFSIMNNSNEDIDKTDENELSAQDSETKSKKRKSKESRNETTKLLLSTLSLTKNKTESPISESEDDKKSFLDEALHNMNNYSPSFASTISDQIDHGLLSRASSNSQDEKDTLSSSDSSESLDDNPEKYIYPKQHLVHNIAKFIKFASGVYGRHFMRFLDIGGMRTTTTVDTYLHPNDYAFSIHTNTPLENILYSSYSSKTTSTTNNIAHIISVDHDMKAIIVTLRGTLGFYDFIIDLEFDYDNLNYKGKDYHVHSGIYQSAKIISQPNSVIHDIVRVALNDYPDYGLVICGHSLGGGVASMLGLLWIDPNKPYVTSVESKLPPNRPLHVYSYGTPSCMQEELATICRTFVTSVVNHYDIIPRLSIGILTDLRNCADELLDEKNHGLAEEIFSRSLATFNKNNSSKELNWFWEKFLLFKKNMNSEKLVPPGVVYIIETADIPVMDPTNYEINNLSEMPLYNDDNTGSNENNKKLNRQSSQNSAYVNMIIDSIHNNNGGKSPIYEEFIFEEREEENEDEEENGHNINNNNGVIDTKQNINSDHYQHHHIDQSLEMHKISLSSTVITNNESSDVSYDTNSTIKETTIRLRSNKKEKGNTPDIDSNSDVDTSIDITMDTDVNENENNNDDDDDDIIEFDVTEDDTLKKQIEKMEHRHPYINSMFSKQQGFEDNKQGRLYTSQQAKKSSKYYSRTPSTLQNKNNENMKRVILLRCEDVKEQFSELAFAKCMFFDHAPVNYENLLNALENAIFKDNSSPSSLF